MNSDFGVLTSMTPVAFIRKWREASLNERQAAQEHFLDLCALFGHPTPSGSDPHGRSFVFEKGANKIGGGRGFADVWKKDHFAWEYKRKNGNLDDALLQLVRYAAALESPPLQVVSDIERFRIHTAWTNTIPVVHEIRLDDLAEPGPREILRNVFFAPEKLKPVRTRAAVTAEAADKFSTIALRLQGRGTPEEVAHFINQLVFCFFVQSVKLLPDGLFTRLLRRSLQKPDGAKAYLDKLFEAMESGGEFDLTEIAWFNGGLFDRRRALHLDEGDIGLLVAADSLDWSMIDPTIFGTLFERFLDPDKRAQIGAHYTDSDKIMKLVDPVVLRPLRAEWETNKQQIIDLLDGTVTPPMRKAPRRRMTAVEAAEEVRSRFGERLRMLRILDPACGSGNFLYLALQGVKDIENRANLECEMLGLHPRLPLVGPEILRGIEINAMAAELARTTIWIGDIQWRLRNGIHSKSIPILRKLEAVETANALISEAPRRFVDSNEATENRGLALGFAPTGRDGTEAVWPQAEFIVGNPPFLGAKLLRQNLGDEAVEMLFSIYDGRVPREADLVCYWFEKALAAIEAGRSSRVGLVTTNSIRGGANRKVLDRISAQSRPFEAWSDQPWVVDGAAVRVSLVCFGNGDDTLRLDDRDVSVINADLTAGATNLTKARTIEANVNVASNGISKKGKFEVDGPTARSWILHSYNPNGKSNDSILFPWRNGEHITRDRFADKWIINFAGLSERDASFYQDPFEHLKHTVKPFRNRSNSTLERRYWWRLARPASCLFDRLAPLRRFIVTPEVSKYRIFVWLEAGICPDKNLIAIARDDDTSFGILHSRFHRYWSLRLGTSLEDRPRYTCSTTFDTFPFPEGLTPDIPSVRYERDPRAVAIAEAAWRLSALRNTWLNPADLVVVEPEVVAGYPDRILPKDATAAATLRERTLTNLYNQSPQWLVDAHRDLDAAVAAAYCWPADISEEDALAKLLELNLSRPAVKAANAQARSAKKSTRRKTPEQRRAEPEFLLPLSGGQSHVGAADLPAVQDKEGEQVEGSGGSDNLRHQA